MFKRLDVFNDTKIPAKIKTHCYENNLKVNEI